MSEMEDAWMRKILSTDGGGEVPVCEYREALTAFAYQLVGAAAVPFMEADPKLIFPSEAMKEIVEVALRRIGVEPAY